MLATDLDAHTDEERPDAEETGLDPVRPDCTGCDTPETALAIPDPTAPTRPTTGADAAADGTGADVPETDPIGRAGTPRDIVEPTFAPASERLTGAEVATGSAVARSIDAESTPAGSAASAAMRRDTIDRPATGNDNTGDATDGEELDDSTVDGIDCVRRRTESPDGEEADGEGADADAPDGDGRAPPVDRPAASAATRSESGSDRSMTAAGTVSPEAVDTGRIGSADDCAVVDDAPRVSGPASERRNATPADGIATAPNE